MLGDRAGPAEHRQAFLDALESAIRRSIATATPAALVLIDLNDFSEVNGAWGLAVGDELLAATAERIASFAAERLSPGINSAFAGRLDADHFGVIVPDLRSIEATRVAVADLIAGLARPITLSGQTLGASARSVLIPIPEYGRSVTSVLGRGFRLLNSRARGKSDGVLLLAADAMPTAFIPALERDLAAALASDQLSIALQPKIEIASGLVRGAEALIRWSHPQYGPIAPPEFISTAEKSGLIFDLGLRVLRDACVASNRLDAAGRGLSIAVNVSPHQLTQPDFLAKVLEIVDRESVDPHTLEIEITETAAMMGGESITRSLQALRRCGIGVAIDDFGTGFSNLVSLSVLPADILKIDRSLVAYDAADRKSEKLLSIAIQLAHAFDVKTVAEGVETAAQLDRVRRLGCDYVQGFLTGRPVRTADFVSSYLGHTHPNMLP
jgi:predicted signal transduction protein with EAL and GGDEF domain